MPGDGEKLALLSEYAAALAAAGDPSAAFRAADEAAGRLIGHRLFTVMIFHQGAMEVERCYSSNPEAYPPGGRKGKRDTDWGRQVLEEGRPYIGRDPADIGRNFDDHARIRELGLGAVLNIPIRSLGRTLGTMNLLDVDGAYDESDLGLGLIIAAGLAGVLVRGAGEWSDRNAWTPSVT